MRLRETFMIIDPSIDQSQMLQFLRLAFRCTPEELDDVEAIKVEALLENLPKSGVYRCGRAY